MRLSDALIDQTLYQLGKQGGLHDARAIADSNPMMVQLNALYGDHTFFLDSQGLHIVEPVEPDGGLQMGRVVKLADWGDDERTSLTPHPAEPTDVLVSLESEAFEADGLLR
jgi:hypothetical protein